MRCKLLFFILLINTFIFADTGLIPLGDRNEDELELVYPRQVIEGPDMNIYTYDEKDSLIKVFSPAGKLLKTLAGPGEGPGYLKRSDGVRFGFTPDKLIYTSEFFGGHRWITLLNLDGSLKETLSPKLEEPFYGVQRIFSLQDGSFLIEFAFLGLPEKKGNFFLHSGLQKIYHMDANGNLSAKIIENKLYQRISYISRGGDIGIPYAPYNYWAPFGKDCIVFTDGMDNVFTILDFKGNTIGHLVTDLPEVPRITDRDIIRWRNNVKERMTNSRDSKEWYFKFGKVIEEYKTPVYKKKPYILSLDTTPEGNILVSTSTRDGVPGTNFRLLNSKGKTMAHGKSNLWDLRFSLHYILLKKIDVDENLTVYYLKRNKDEKEDFNRLFRLLKNGGGV